jgi:sugar/nucleoside kinase (ribokinase family)
MPAAVKAARLAKQHGLTVSMDIEPDNAARITDFNPLLAQVDIAFVNQRAVKFLGESDSLEAAARRVLSYGPQIVCITMGANGSLAVSAVETFQAQAFPVQVVDSTGAGDCFAAGFVYGFLQNWPLAQTATFASAVGALSVTQRGGHSNLPDLAQVIAFLIERGVKL